MKTTMKTMLSLLLAATLLISALVCGLPAAAEEETGGTETITATSIMEPINPNASQEAKNLLAYLSSLKDTNTFVSGAFEMGTDLGIYHALEDQFGVQVGLSSCRYAEEVRSDYSPEDGTHDVANITNEAEASAMLLEQYQKGHILLIHFDGALLTWMQTRTVEKYGSEDNGIIHLDATNPDRDMELYNAAMVYYEKLVGVLKRLEDSGVKAYLYRAFVEFSNHNFNGVDVYGKEVLTRVMQQYAELMKDSGLTGFLLTTSPNGGYYTRDCYPGNAYCDLLGVTIYSKEDFDGELSPSVQFTDYDWYTQTGKPFGFTELSCRTGSYTKQNAQGRCSWYKTLTSMLQYWPEVAFTNTWGGGTYSLINHNSAGSETGGNDDGAWFLHSPYTLNLEDLPDYQNTAFKMPGVAKLYDTPNYGGNNTADTLNQNFVALEERLYSEAQLKKMGINPKDILSFYLSDGFSITAYSGDNGTGESWSYLNSSAYIGDSPSAGKIRSVEISRPKNILLDYSEIYASDNDMNAWKANDGLNSYWIGQADEKGEGWIMADMGVPYTINRWSVWHAGYVGMLDLYNTRDFCLQISDDGETWTTVDAVAGNIDSYTNRTLEPAVQARYFRLFVTGANNGALGMDANQITIAEFELYGVPAPVLANQTPGDTSDVTDEQPEDTSDEDIADEWEDTTDEEQSAEEEELPQEEDFQDQTESTEDTPEDEQLSTDGEPEDTSDEEVSEPDTSDDEDDDKPNRKKRKQVITEVYYPWWMFALIGLGVLVVAGVVVLIILRHRKKKVSAQPTQADNT